MKNIGKIIKIIALVLGVLGLVISFLIVYLSTRPAEVSSNVFFTAYQILMLFMYLFIIITVCSLVYATGHLIEMVQSMNKNIDNIKADMNASKPSQKEQTNDDIPATKANMKIEPTKTTIDKDTMWRRPENDDSTLS